MIRYWPALASVLLCVGAIAGYYALLRVPAIRNHPALYLVAFALAAVIAGVATWRAARWPNFVALGLSVVLLILGAYFNFVLARVPSSPVALRVGEPAPDFTLPDAAGVAVSLASFRGRTPVVLVFYRGYW
jgi:cytochrome oxidase Cu insertion factor (SCO1/SenC/PrrC family)